MATVATVYEYARDNEYLRYRESTDFIKYVSPWEVDPVKAAIERCVKECQQ